MFGVRTLVLFALLDTLIGASSMAQPWPINAAGDDVWHGYGTYTDLAGGHLHTESERVPLTHVWRQRPTCGAKGPSVARGGRRSGETHQSCAVVAVAFPASQRFRIRPTARSAPH